MPSLTWNETRDRALKFSRAWATARHEEQDKQTFWNEFFDCFGIPRKSVAVFEHAVANVKRHYGFIDLFWPSKLLVEQKSRGAALGKAESQAFKYLEDLAREGRHDEMPRYIVLCDFNRFALYDLEPEETKDLPSLNDGRRYRLVEFPLSELYHHVREFAFMRGEKAVRLDPDDPANFKATQLLAGLHDALESTGFTGHELERMLVRLLFCLFAEHTGIFDAPGCFQSLVSRTKEDGSDLGPQLAQLFQVLNQPTEQRQKNLDEDLAAFPYVNGGLFAESPPIVAFNSDHRKALLSCCHFHWAKISPAVFGSLFQGVMDKKERRQAGAHYTSERDIMKLIRSLFLDGLRADLDAAVADRSTNRKKRLQEFQKKLRSLKFFDPACGCGNFLILAYREIRRLENEALIAINTHTLSGKVQAELLDIRELAQVDVDQFYGIEIGEWPVRIAEVGLWLTDHQCNMELAEALGRSFRRLPLKATPTLKVANALQTDWGTVLAPSECSYVLGNPPFVGAKHLDAEQSRDMELITAKIENGGLLDYVTAWYFKAAEFIQGTRIRVGFV
jgi:type I restriction-modification system DNA methylase subunit